MSQRGQPRLAAVVVLAPGDGMERAHARVAVVSLLSLGEGAVVHRGKEAHPLRLGYEVVPLVLVGEGSRQPLGRGIVGIEGVDRPGLLGGVVLYLGPAEQPAEPVPVVVGAEGVVYPQKEGAAPP